MIRSILLALVAPAMMLAACTASAPPPIAPSEAAAPEVSVASSAAAERAVAAYVRIRARAVAVLPYLPEPIAGRVGSALEIGDASIALTRAGTPAEREAALRRLIGVAADIVSALTPRLTR